MKKIILTIFTVFLLASCAMEDVSNSYNESEIGVRAAGEVAEVSSTSNANSDITFDSSCLLRKPDIDFGIVWTETEAAHAAGIQGLAYQTEVLVRLGSPMQTVVMTITKNRKR